MLGRLLTSEIIRLPNAKGWISLVLAAQLGRLSVCKLLIQNGAKPTLSFWAEGCTPLFAAINSGDYKTVQFLVSNRCSRLRAELSPINELFVFVTDIMASSFIQSLEKDIWEGLVWQICRTKHNCYKHKFSAQLQWRCDKWIKLPSQIKSRQVSDSRHLSWSDQERALLMHISAITTDFSVFFLAWNTSC